MGIRHWFRSRVLGEEAVGDDVPPNLSLMTTLLGRDERHAPSLGEYNARSYPTQLAELLRRREEVAAELLRIDVTDRQERISSIPRLQAMLGKYPHPLVYETLINAYVDSARYDEAKGVAFAARERRQECERSDYPEIRAEIGGLREWSPQEIDELKAEGGARR